MHRLHHIIIMIGALSFIAYSYSLKKLGSISVAFELIIGIWHMAYGNNERRYTSIRSVQSAKASVLSIVLSRGEQEKYQVVQKFILLLY